MTNHQPMRFADSVGGHNGDDIQPRIKLVYRKCVCIELTFIHSLVAYQRLYLSARHVIHIDIYGGIGIKSVVDAYVVCCRVRIDRGLQHIFLILDKVILRALPLVRSASSEYETIIQFVLNSICAHTNGSAILHIKTLFLPQLMSITFTLTSSVAVQPRESYTVSE